MKVNGARAVKGGTLVGSGGDVTIVAMEFTQNEQLSNFLRRIRRSNDDH